MRIAITGATGYVGNHLIKAACNAGYDILALSRSPVRNKYVSWQAYDLNDNNSALILPEEIEVVFHLAAVTNSNYGCEVIELAAARRILDAVKSINAYVIFISSQTARPDAPTEYGKVKWKIERMVLADGGRIIRPGLVYGGNEKGLFGSLCQLIRHKRVLPNFIPQPIIQPIHVDDLSKALLSSTSLPQSTLLHLGAPEGICFSNFLQVLVRGRVSRKVLFFPVPRMIINLLNQVLSKRLQNKVGLNRISSLFSLPMMETSDDLDRLCIKLRPLSNGVTRSGLGRRELIREACTLLTYIMRVKPNSSLLRRYVRVIESFKGQCAVRLPKIVSQWPVFLGLMDGTKYINEEFRDELNWRLNAALLIAESCPQGSKRFIGGDTPPGWFKSGLQMTWTLNLEIIRRVGQIFARPFLARIGRHGVYR